MSLLIHLYQFSSMLFVYTVGCVRSSDSSNTGKVINKVNNQRIPDNYRLSCSDNETKTLACLNGGSCFVVYVEDRIVQCACSNRYIGNRCEMIDPEIIFGQSQTEEKEDRIGWIIAFSAIMVLLFIAVVLLIYIKRKFHRENNRYRNIYYKDKMFTFHPVKLPESYRNGLS